MNLIENILIIAGISLDIFADVECQGSLVAKVDKKQLAAICGVMMIWQFAALALGDRLALLFYGNAADRDGTLAGFAIAAVIFFGLGIRLFVKAARSERIQERRQESLKPGRSFRMAAATSIYTLLAGMAFGLLGTYLPRMLVIVLLITAIVVISGIYTGYRFGSEYRTKAYFGGAILLWIAGADVMVRDIMCYLAAG